PRTIVDGEVGPTTPLRIGIELAQAGAYAVHVELRRGSSDVWSSTRCLVVGAVVRLRIELSALDVAADQDRDGWTLVGPDECAALDEELDDCDDTIAIAHPFGVDVCGTDVDEDCRDGDAACADGDQDGWTGDLDCDDADPEVHPDAIEDCDPERDLDCDREPRCDRDADGFPEGADCDDGDPEVHPGATEQCAASDVDRDCDGTPANGCTVEDQDGDGAIAREVGGPDCDDCDPGARPGAA